MVALGRLLTEGEKAIAAVLFIGWVFPLFFVIAVAAYAAQTSAEQAMPLLTSCLRFVSTYLMIQSAVLVSLSRLAPAIGASPAHRGRVKGDATFSAVNNPTTVNTSARPTKS